MTMKWNLKKVKVSDLKENPKNPRKLTEKGLKDLEKSITKFGVAEPLVCNTDFMLCGGHGRKKILERLNIKEVDCYFPEKKLTGKQFDELGVRLNRNIAGEFDFDILANEFEVDELIEWGFEEKELDLNLWNDTDESKLDEVPEVPKVAVSKLGDLFLLDGKHRVMCGDSTKAEDVDKLMDGKKAEILFTSPPYSDMKNYNNDKNLQIDYLVCFINAFSNLVNYLIINLGIQRKENEINQYWDEYIKTAKNNNYKFLSWNAWIKPNASSIGQQTAIFPINMEFIFVFGVTKKEINRTVKTKTGGKRMQNYSKDKDGNQTDKGSHIRNEFTKIPTAIQITQEGKPAGNHPATFPVKLPIEYINAMTNLIDIVCDSFLGSGSTLIACQQTKRICYGMELDPIYIDVILKRYKKLYPEAKFECLNRKYDFNKLFTE